MDPYERLAAINEALNGEKPESESTEETPETTRKNILKMIKKAANTTEDPNRVAARLAAQTRKQDRSIFGDSPFGGSIQDSFDPSKDPNAEADQEFDNAAQALRDAGIAYKALKRIGSMNREKDIFKINRKDMRQAREVMQDFPNTQIKRA